MNFYNEKLNDFVKRCMANNYYLECDLDKKDYYKETFKNIVENNLKVNNEANNTNIKINTNIIESSSDMFKGFCNVSIKSYNDYIFNVNESLFFVLFNFMSEINNNEILFNNMKPIDFDLTYTIVFKILIYHELGHIFKGHLLYKEKYKLDKNCKEDILDILTLEYDADCFAFTQVFQIFMKDYDNVLKKMSNQSKQNNNCVTGLRYVFIYLIFSIRLLFFIFSDVNDINNIDNNAHPPMLLREIWAKNILEKIYHDKIAIDNQFNYFIDEFNKYYRGDKIIEIQNLILNNREKISLLSDRIEKNWQDNKEKFKEFYYFTHNDI